MKSLALISLVGFALLTMSCSKRPAPDWLLGDWILDEELTKYALLKEGEDFPQRGGFQFIQLFEEIKETTYSFRSHELVELRRGGNGIVRPFTVLSVHDDRVELKWSNNSVSTYRKEPGDSFIVFFTDFEKPTAIVLKKK